MTTAAIEYCLTVGKTPPIDENKMEQIRDLLTRYIDSIEDREIEALYAVQAKCKELEYPSGMLIENFLNRFSKSLKPEIVKIFKQLNCF